MSDLQTMKPCPTCGAMLTAALADAIANPGAPESCPSDPKTITAARKIVADAARPLATGGLVPPTGPIIGDNSYIIPTPARSTPIVNVVVNVANTFPAAIARSVARGRLLG